MSIRKKQTARYALPVTLLLGLAAAGGTVVARTGSGDMPAAPPEQARAYAAEVPKSIVELQAFRRTRSQDIEGPGGRTGRATLVDLNPAVHAWHLLTLDWGGGDRAYHLENAAPGAQEVELDPGYRAGLVLRTGDDRRTCDLWASGALEEAARRGMPYAPLCEGRLYLRNTVQGRRTEMEAVVDFLRDHVWGGEAIVGLAKRTVFRDAQLERARLGPADRRPPETPGPRPADLDPAYADRTVATAGLGVAVEAARGGALQMGSWYAARDVEGVYVSLIEPQAVAAPILKGHRDRVSALDGVEASALVYLAAFDLGRFDLAFGLGTGHPRVDWSPRPPASARVPALPGPDGIGTIRPLVATGMVTPRDAPRTAATFTGGFKRAHGAFKYGELSLKNRGSHYGFVEEGVVFSKLRPGLATLLADTDGGVRMKTWTEDDDRSLARVRYARQNGVPLVEWDEVAGGPVPGALVNRWGPGNWSGSANEELRSVRAGACLQETPGARYLLYAYFSSATPSAMARVFQAYGCRYAMLLDMNAPVHTYLAVYGEPGTKGAVQHLMQAMAEGDPKVRGRAVPRFVGLPDDRDFFYLTRRSGPGGGR